MHLYQELVEPSVVTHSLICKLDSKKPNSLIVARGASLLQVFSILPSPPGYVVPELANKLLGFTGELPFAGHGGQYLKFESQWPLDGTLIGINSVVQNGHLVLILAFKYAKIAILEWLPEKKTFKPSSLHYYEKQVLEDNFRDLKFPGKLIVEPKSQCLTLWYQKDMFSVLSFPDIDMQMFEDIKMGSTVLRPENLEPECRNIIDMNYLHGYNGATMGVLFQKNPAWTGTLPINKDSVSYQIISVDIERKSSTTIFSVEKLPFDIQQVVPLHAPIHGSLLVGSNSLVFVESNGRTMAYSVNGFASGLSDYALIDDYTHLGIELANSKVVQLPQSEHLLIVTAAGELFQLKFEIDGLKVFGLCIERVAGFPNVRTPTSVSVDPSNVFIACNSTSVLIKYQLTHTDHQLPSPPIDEEFEDVYPVDLGPTELKLELSDALVALGPITCTTLIEGDNYDDPSTLCVGFGGEMASGIACLRQGLWPDGGTSITSGNANAHANGSSKFSRIYTAGSFLIGTSASQNWSWLYRYAGGPQAFEPESNTIRLDVFTLAFALTSVGHYWHIYTTGFDIYDRDWALKTSHTFENAAARSAVISGSHALVCSKESLDITLYSLRDFKLQSEEIIGRSKKFHLFGEHIVIADDANISFATVHEPAQQDKYNFLNLPDNVKDAAAFTNYDDELEAGISEVLIAQVGDQYSQQLVLALVIGDILTVYSFNQLLKLYTGTCYANLGLYACNFGGLSALVAGGSSPFLLLKGHKTPIRSTPIRTNRILSAASIGSDLVFVDTKKRIRTIFAEPEWDYLSLGWPATATPVGETVSCIAYNNTAEVIIIGTNVPHEREGGEADTAADTAPDTAPDTAETGTAAAAAATPRCTTFRSFLKVINPETLRITDSVPLGEEAVLCMKSVRMEIGVNTEQFKEFLAVGTSILLDEDNVSNGHFYVYSVAEIVPSADRPEVRHKVKEIFKELCAGAVTSLYPVMGKLAVAQGQHLFMKAVQEDHTIDPIAFCDLEVYVSDLKGVRNLIVAGDYFRSTCLVNYGDEPNRLDVISKDLEPNQGVVATECLSSEMRQDLCAVSSDSQGRLKILQYDPDNVHSRGGPKLVVQSHFYIGAVVNAMVMVYGKHRDLGAIGCTNMGGIVSIMPITEEEYRALYVVTQQLMDKEQSFACLNTRSHLNTNCHGGETQVIYGPTANKFWGLSRSKQTAYSRKLGRRGLDGVFEALMDDPLDYL